LVLSEGLLVLSEGLLEYDKALSGRDKALLVLDFLGLKVWAIVLIF
jgi:hypothetical protein